jgi:hypothetical protein
MRVHDRPGRAMLGLVLAGLLLTGCAEGGAAAPPPRPPSPVDSVAMNPAVQQWFKRTEPQRIAVNDALGQVNSQLTQGTSATAATACAQLLEAAKAMLATLPTPKHALDPQVVAGVDQLRTGAEQCIAGDLAAARPSISAGADARAAAEDELEEILEAPNASVK